MHGGGRQAGECCCRAGSRRAGLQRKLGQGLKQRDLSQGM
jgi:hypothetical protein